MTGNVMNSRACIIRISKENVAKQDNGSIILFLCDLLIFDYHFVSLINARYFFF